MINILIVHYNTPKLTESLIKSINKFVGMNCHIYIFDNSDKFPFKYKQANLTVFDNTKGKIINFNKELNKYPNHIYSLGSRSHWGSFKHCISVDKCFDLIDDNFILLDSDILLKKDIRDICDEAYYSSGEIQDWSWGTDKNIFPIHKRIIPFITFINVNKAKLDGIRYYNSEHMDGLYDSTHKNKPEQMERDSWDTGCWFYEQIKNKPIKCFKCDDYIVHFRGGSYAKIGGNERLTSEQWLNKYKKYYSGEKNKKVVYTCITGGYDTLLEPLKITDDFDYVCFTDNKNLVSPIWEIKELPSETNGMSKAKINRYIKTHPHLLFPDYDLSIYVDGSILIKGNLDSFTKDICSNTPIAIPQHPDRNCTYDEGKACIQCKKDTVENIKPQLDRYKEEGFPTHYGLTQNNIIIRKHNDSKCIELMETWWKEIESGSHRDQLSLMYAVWKTPGITIEQLDKKTCNSAYFTWYSKHNGKSSFMVLSNSGGVRNDKSLKSFLDYGFSTSRNFSSTAMVVQRQNENRMTVVNRRVANKNPRAIISQKTQAKRSRTHFL